MNPAGVIGMVQDLQFGALPLLMRPEVQKELKINKSQNDEMKKLQKEQSNVLKEKMKAGQSSDTAQMMEVMKQMQASQTDLNNRAKALLTDDQRQRLGEIRLQAMGFQSFQALDVQKALEMTPEQKASLSPLGNEFTIAKMKMMQSVRTAGAYKSKLAALETEFQARVEKIITVDQNTLWKKMQGEPFKDISKIRG